MKKTLLSLAFLTLITTNPSYAMQQNIVELPDGHTVLNISATEREEVEQDLLIASMRIQQEGKNAKTVQNEINSNMKKAVDIAKQYPNVKIETGQYYVHPDYRNVKGADQNNRRVFDKWRGSQTIILKSKQADEILQATQKIQALDFLMNNLSYQLSPEKHNEIRDQLMEKTIKALNERAQRVAKALGKRNVDLVQINVDSSQHFPPVAYARGAQMESSMMMDKSMAAPVAESGETSVSMTINAQAIIKP